MENWLRMIREKQNKKAMPILSFPAIQKLDCTVLDLISNSDMQAKAMQMIVDEYDPLASLGLMDLSVEAECFGSRIRVEEGEVPTVIGNIINDVQDANDLQIPKVGEKRTQIYIDAIAKAKQLITDRPVFAGCIGPFSLAGRLLDVSEAMIYCYEDPDMVHVVLDKVTSFLIDYITAYKRVGANGVVMAEPLAGILSPDLCDEFSSQYIKRIVEAISDENFIVIYHNCGNNTLKMVDTILSTGCKVFHFGNSIAIEEMVKVMPSDVIVMGNVDPVLLKNGTKEEVIQQTKQILSTIGNKENFIISSGCDIPPTSSLDNIKAFMQICNSYYQE